MNLRQHSEAAAKRSWNELPSLANLLFYALFIFLKPSAMFDMADHEAQLNGLQNPMILTAGITCFDLYLASPGGRGRVPFRTLSQDGCHLLTTASPLTSSRELHHFPLRFTHPPHWLHPAHFNLIFLPHVPRLSVDESLRLLCLMLVLKLRTFPKDQNKGKRSQNNKTPTLNKYKSSEHNLRARMNTGILCVPEQILHYGYPEGRLVPLPCTESYTAPRICGRSRTPKRLGPLLHFNRYHNEMAVHLFPFLLGFWGQGGMRILISDS